MSSALNLLTIMVNVSLIQLLHFSSSGGGNFCYGWEVSGLLSVLHYVHKLTPAKTKTDLI